MLGKEGLMKMRIEIGLLTTLLVVATIAAAPGALAQSVKADDNIETDAQLVSNVATGTPPLAVVSTTVVPNLNADLLGGKLATFFASQAQLIDARADLDNPAPPCFNLVDRFVDCGNGTVTDTNTGLIWLKEHSCLPALNYQIANEVAALINDGGCGLTDGSRPGDWRLPTYKEFSDIMRSYCAAPKIIGKSGADRCHADEPWANNVRSAFYWTSQSQADEGDVALDANLTLGDIDLFAKTALQYMWPVRGGR